MKNKIQEVVFRTISFILLAGCFSFTQIFAQKKEDLKAKFNAKQTNSRKTVQWKGEWNLSSRFYPQNLKITNVSAKQFKFILSSANGANSGEISGNALIKGSKAFFDDRRISKKEFDAYGCQLLFVNRGNLLDIDSNLECNGYGGNGVHFGGDLQKGKQPVAEIDLVSPDILPTKQLDRKFKSLTGKDYENFLNSFHILYDETDLDNFGAKVISACVRGICSSQAGIIMYDAKGNIWAAVLEEKEDKINVNYYTNNAAWTNKLPKTIEKWADEKKEVDNIETVIYKNQK